MGRPAVRGRTLLLTLIAMLAFAANSVLCRKALAQTSLDPASFTLIRLASGAVMLGLLARFSGKKGWSAGSWPGAVSLLTYAASFSIAYLWLPAGSGALLLFGAVQATMIAKALISGERLNKPQWLGLALALGGLAVLVAPGVAAPDPAGAALMLLGGVAWGVYSLLGRASKEPALAVTAGNFLRATPLALPLFLLGQGHWDEAGALYALLSGALASGLGYALWYAALPGLRASSAASIQLSVPVITALGSVALLGESISLRLALCSIAVLGGIALVIRKN